MSVPSHPPTRPPIRRHSLYGRAAVTMVLGCGVVFGAVAALSVVLLEDSRQQLLEERVHLARHTGSMIEDRIRDDLARLAVAGRDALASPAEAARLREITTTDRETRFGLFSHGVGVLDASGAPVVASPSRVDELLRCLDIASLVERVRDTGRPAISPLLWDQGRPLLVAMAPLTSATGPPLGYVVGAIPSALRELLPSVHEMDDASGASIDIVDADGVVVAGSAAHHLYQTADHDGTLAEAIRERRAFTGRCHVCHEGGADAPERETDVLAFAPLPELALGVAVLQPEAAALAPAVALRWQLVGLAVAVVSLFVIFTGLAVRSVVRPVTALTRDVRRAEVDGAPLRARDLGDDEIGELGAALGVWHRRMIRSLAAAESHRDALAHETRSVVDHLAALRHVAELSTSQSDLDAVLDGALDRALAGEGLTAGALWLEHGLRQAVVRRGIDSNELAPLRALAGEAVGDGDGARIAPLASAALAQLGVSCSAAWAGVATAAGGARAVALIVADNPNASLEQRWLTSLLVQVGVCASHLLLRDAERERKLQQEHYLHRVMRAQEDERARVARDLHDTVAQDLAALRLELERLADQGDDGVRARVVTLEQRAVEMLETVRRILLDLRISVLESMGFLAALRWQLDRVARDAGVRTQLVVNGDESIEPSYEVAVALFRILQESVMNSVQHGRSGHVFATVVLDAARIELTVEDDGIGFDVAMLAPRQGARGLGVLGMEERARLVGGSCRISSIPGEGTTVEVVVPLAAAESEAEARGAASEVRV